MIPREVGDRVFVLTHPEFGVNCTLVAGDSAAMLVDTLSDEVQGAQLAEAVRRITPHPLTVVNTHFHFDHCFGNAAFALQGIWGHPDCAAELSERGEHWRRVWQRDYERDLSAVRIVVPDRLVPIEQTLHIGDREVVLGYHGRGHTGGDLTVRVDSVIVAGDLVEEGAPPAFEDAYPLEWPSALASLMTFASPATVIIPGHGAMVGLDFLTEQHSELAELARLIREGHAAGTPIEEVAAASPLNRWGPPGQAQSEFAVNRGYAQLAGRRGRHPGFG